MYTQQDYQLLVHESVRAPHQEIVDDVGELVVADNDLFEALCESDTNKCRKALCRLAEWAAYLLTDVKRLQRQLLS